MKNLLNVSLCTGVGWSDHLFERILQLRKRYYVLQQLEKCAWNSLICEVAAVFAEPYDDVLSR